LKNDNFLSESDFQTASSIIKYKDEKSVLDQLTSCSQSHAENKAVLWQWIVPVANASVGCPVTLPNGTSYIISPTGASTCLDTFRSLTDGMEKIAAGEGTPGNNQAQNKQVRDIVVDLGLNRDQQRQLHDEITGQDPSY